LVLAVASLIKFSAIEMYGRVKVNCHILLTLATGGGGNKGFYFIPVYSVQDKIRKEFKKSQLPAVYVFIIYFCS
jgi:hypothetical protein